MSFEGPMQRKPYPSRCSVCGSQFVSQLNILRVNGFLRNPKLSINV
jgi:hypothetical protein